MSVDYNKVSKSFSSGHKLTDQQVSNKAQSAGAPGSAGIVGSKRWLKAHREQMGDIASRSDHSVNC